MSRLRGKHQRRSGIPEAVFSEILFYGSLLSLVWFFSDILANRDIYCGFNTGNFSQLCSIRGVSVVQNLNYHYNLYWFFGTCLAGFVGFNLHLHFKSNLYSSFDKDSATGAVFRLMSWVSAIVAGLITVVFFGLMVFNLLFQTNHVPWHLWTMLLAGISLVIAGYFIETWNTIPTEKSKAIVESDFKRMSLEGIAIKLHEDMNRLYRLQAELKAGVPTDTELQIDDLRQTIRSGLQEANVRHNELQSAYDESQSIIDDLAKHNDSVLRYNLAL